ncbi:MAG: hypothetical protein JEZ09_13800 [Salinivirgaceae bacterium]|nr:hypothetical protein [Salinivirgaceae bacterium]
MLFKNKKEDKIVATAVGKKLTMSQLKMAIPADMKEIDSISFAQNYIEKWVKNQLLLKKAEMNLDKKTQDNIEVMIDNYRTSLMLFKYQQKLIQQKLDTVVTEDQINEYYTSNAENFRLDSSVVKAIYVKLPKSLHDRYRVRSWIKSSKEDDMITLEDYCYQNARNFYMGEEWQYFGTLLNEVPRKISNQNQFLRTNSYIETTDSLYAYYVQILDYKLTNDTTPVKFVTSQVKDIIINHRKVSLINRLENNVYTDAVNLKKFTIHTN